MDKSLKSISISLGVLFAVGLLILGAEAFRGSVDAKTEAIVEAQHSPAKFGYGQLVEISLPSFYKTCNNRGVLDAYDSKTRKYKVTGVVCPEGANVQTINTFVLKESDIIRVIEEEK